MVNDVVPADIADLGGVANAIPLATSPNARLNWKIPANSFTDVDSGDTLSYHASLADGAALPVWLSFDATTQTFSGRVPRTATGFIDILVRATDKAGASASDIFDLSFTGTVRGGGGGGGGGSQGGGQGDEGVGNGPGGAPPGQDYNFNGGPGTSPGNPGAQGGNGYVPPSHDEIFAQFVFALDSGVLQEPFLGGIQANSIENSAVALVGAVSTLYTT